VLPIGGTVVVFTTQSGEVLVEARYDAIATDIPLGDGISLAYDFLVPVTGAFVEAEEG
jgi:hypothetical protein